MGYDTTKPREESDLKDIYPDLDECKALPVFIVRDDTETLEEFQEKSLRNHPLVGPLNQNTFKELKFETPDIRFDRSMIEYGFQDSNKRYKRTSSTYIRPFQTEEHESIQAIVERKQKLVEYDMDEQDYLYLEHLNGQLSGGITLTSEIFEILFTTLENEWVKLEDQMNSINEEDFTLSTTTLDYQGIINDEEYGNDDGIVGGLADDQKCAICNDSDCDNSNAIVFCDGCNIAVHQECYGVAFIPEGQWLCRKCMINKHKQCDCIFCPSKTGAFKQLDNSLWSHVLCALWINELYFANPIYMEPIEGIDLIPKSRWKLNCYICKSKDTGACIQCSNKNCFSAYHVTCAKRAKLYMNMSKGVQGAVHNKLTLKSYCDKHTPHDYYLSQNQVINGINKTRKFFRDLKLLNWKNAQLSKTQRLNNKLNILKWKTESNTPIAPKIFRDYLTNKLISFRLDDNLERESKKSSLLRGLGNKITLTKQEYFEQMEFLSNEICKYWCLKRELKNGAPLIRKNDNLVDSIVYGNNQEMIDEKLEFGEVLLKDLRHLIDLSNYNLTRQILQKQTISNKESIYRFNKFTVSKFIDVVVDEIIAADTKKFLRYCKTFNIIDIKRKNDNLEYDTYGKFLDDITYFSESITQNNKPGTAMVKYGKKMMDIVEKVVFDESLLASITVDAVEEAKLLAEQARLREIQENEARELRERQAIEAMKAMELEDEILTDFESLNEVEEYKLSTFLK